MLIQPALRMFASAIAQVLEKWQVDCQLAAGGKFAEKGVGRDGMKAQLTDATLQAADR